MGRFSLEQFLVLIPAILVAITIHEFMHGKVADLLGDSTAREKRRLSLNPIRHLDPIGTLMFLVAGFGWAKPVPVNPHRFHKPVRDMMLVGLAGPLANFVAAFILARLYLFALPDILSLVLAATIQINVVLGIFNLLPIPPLDGSRIVPYFLPSSMQQVWLRFEQYGVVVLLLLVIALPGSIWSIMKYPVNLMLKFVYVGLA